MLSGPHHAPTSSPGGPFGLSGEQSQDKPPDPASSRTLAIANLRRAASHRQIHTQPALPVPPAPSQQQAVPASEHDSYENVFDNEHCQTSDQDQGEATKAPTGDETDVGGAVDPDHDGDGDDYDEEDDNYATSHSPMHLAPTLNATPDVSLQLQMQQLLQTQQQIQQLQAALLAQGTPAHLVNSTGADPNLNPSLTAFNGAQFPSEILGQTPLMAPLLGLLPSSAPGVSGLGVGLNLPQTDINFQPPASLDASGPITAPSLGIPGVSASPGLGIGALGGQPLPPPQPPSSKSPTSRLHPPPVHTSSREPPQRSPLPSLEQLRARVLHERQKQSLRRSASTSAAAHAVARAHALEKLIGAGAGISQRRALSPSDHLEAGRNRARRRALLGHAATLDEVEAEASEEDEEPIRTRSIQLSSPEQEGIVSLVVTDEKDESSDNSEDEDLWGDALRSEKRASRIPLSEPLGPLMVASLPDQARQSPRGRPTSVRPLRQGFRNSNAPDTSSFSRPLLRRSRTVGGLTAMAEQERRAEFLESLLAPEEEGTDASSSRPVSPSPMTTPPIDTPRSVARAQLLRKLSARTPAGRRVSREKPQIPESSTSKVSPSNKAAKQATTGKSSALIHCSFSAFRCTDIVPDLHRPPEGHPRRLLSRPLSIAQGARLSMLRPHSGDDSELSEVTDSDHERIDDEYLARVDQMADTLGRFTEESATRTRATDSLSSNTPGATSTAAAATNMANTTTQMPSGRSFGSEPDFKAFFPANVNGSSTSLAQVSNSHGLQQPLHSPTAAARMAQHGRTQSATSPAPLSARLSSSSLSPPSATPEQSVNHAQQKVPVTPSRAARLPQTATKITPDKLPFPTSGVNVEGPLPAPQLVPLTPRLDEPNISSSSAPSVKAASASSPFHAPERPHLFPDPATHHAERTNSHAIADRSPSLLSRSHSQSGRLKRSLLGSLRRKKAPEPLNMNASPLPFERTSPSWHNRQNPSATSKPISLGPQMSTPLGRHLSPGFNLTTPKTPDTTLDAGFSQQASPSSAPASAADAVHSRTTEQLRGIAHALTSPSPPSSIVGAAAAGLPAPPRQLLRAVPVFQVVTASGIKDRFLFVFTDVVIIAKPVAAPKGGGTMLGMADLSWLFSVKSILEIRSLRLSIHKEHVTEPGRPHPLMKSLVARFPRKPDQAIEDVLTRSGLPHTPESVATILSQTPDLDKDVLTTYLCDPRKAPVLDAYLGCQRLVGVSVESALRALLLGLRFPARYEDAERLLDVFVTHWTEANAALIKPGFTKDIAFALVMDMLRLNDALHAHDPSAMAPKYRYPQQDDGALWNTETNADAFVAHVRGEDPRHILSDQTLMRIYASIRSEPLAVALSSDDPRPQPVFLSAPMPSRIIYGQPSAPVTISIPRPDRDFAIRLYGPDIVFDPPVLTFSHAASRNFTMTSRVLGPKQVVFVRAGRKSRYYAGTLNMTETGAALAHVVPLPRSAPVTVERAFMQHTFVLTSPSDVDLRAGTPTGLPKRFMFSLEDGEKRAFVTEALTSMIEAVKHTEVSPVARCVDATALEALRALLLDTSDGANAPPLQRSASAGAGSDLWLNLQGGAQPPSALKASHVYPGGSTSTAAVGDVSKDSPKDSPKDTSTPGLSRGKTLRQALGGLTRRLDRTASASHARLAPGRNNSIRDPERHAERQHQEEPSLPGSTPGITKGPTAESFVPSMPGERTNWSPALTGMDIVAICRHNSLLPQVLALMGS